MSDIWTEAFIVGILVSTVRIATPLLLAAPGELITDASEVGALYELHGVKPLIAGGARGEDLHEVRVLDASQRADLPAKACLDLRVARDQETLQRHLATERLLPGAVDDAHATPADPRENLEVADSSDGVFAGSVSGVIQCGSVARLLGLTLLLPLTERLCLHGHAEGRGEKRTVFVTRVVSIESTLRVASHR